MGIRGHYSSYNRDVYSWLSRADEIQFAIGSGISQFKESCRCDNHEINIDDKHTKRLVVYPISFTAAFSNRLTMRVVPHPTRHSIATNLQHPSRLSVHILQLLLVRTQHVLRQLIPVDH